MRTINSMLNTVSEATLQTHDCENVCVSYRSHDFYRILTEPENNMLKQQQALMETEGIQMEFTDAAIREISRVAEEVCQISASLSLINKVVVLQMAVLSLTCKEGLLHIPTWIAMLFQVNTSVDNIGARRLHTVLERIVEDISFDAPEKVRHYAVPSLWGVMSSAGTVHA